MGVLKAYLCSRDRASANRALIHKRGECSLFNSILCPTCSSHCRTFSSPLHPIKYLACCYCPFLEAIFCRGPPTLLPNLRSIDYRRCLFLGWSYPVDTMGYEPNKRTVSLSILQAIVTAIIALFMVPLEMPAPADFRLCCHSYAGIVVLSRLYPPACGAAIHNGCCCSHNSVA